jgi:hypothetical protein
MHRTGTAEREEREIARIEPTLDSDDANRALHIGIDYANHAARRERGTGMHRGGELPNRAR